MSRACLLELLKSTEADVKIFRGNANSCKRGLKIDSLKVHTPSVFDNDYSKPILVVEG